MRKRLGKSVTGSIYQLKITLERVRPPIWRRVQTSGNIFLPELHYLVQAAMGWQGGHLHTFHVDGDYYGERDQDFDDTMLDERKVMLAHIAPAEKSKFRYEYDFGDDWRHLIVVEKILTVDTAQTYPVCVAGKRACPPEDCGGPWGYAEFLEALAIPEHEQNKELSEWIGGAFDPEAFDIAAVNARLRGA